VKNLTGICAIFISLLFLAASAVAEDPLSTKVNIVLQDGTIMFYMGEDAGIKAGDEFEVTRGGQVVGHVKASKTKKLFTYAELVDGDVQEMDTVVRTKAAGEAGETKKETKEDKDSGDESGEKPVRKKSSKSKASEDSDKSSASSKRREDAKEEKPAEKKADRSGKEPSSDKEKSKGPVLKPEPVDKHQSKLPPIGMLRPAALGLSGMLYTPTADSMPNGRGAVHLLYAGSDDELLGFQDTGIGFTYGLAGNVEIAYTHISSDLDAPPTLGGASFDSSAGSFSLKYQLGMTDTIMSSSTTESRYALGFQYYSKSDSTFFTSSSRESGTNATRLFAISSHKYSMGVGHLGLYYQSGDLLDDTSYSGVGFTGGIEYAFGDSVGGALSDTMSFILEYDSKAFYLGTYQTPSIGLRYNFRRMGHVTLGIMDVSDSSVLLINGAYDF